MSYHTHEEEKRSALIDQCICNVGELVLLMLKARTDKQLEEQITPTSIRLLNGRVHVINCAVPRFEDLRFKICETHELLQKLETELMLASHRIQDQVSKDSQREVRNG